MSKHYYKRKHSRRTRRQRRRKGGHLSRHRFSIRYLLYPQDTGRVSREEKDRLLLLPPDEGEKKTGEAVVPGKRKLYLRRGKIDGSAKFEGLISGVGLPILLIFLVLAFCWSLGAAEESKARVPGRYEEAVKKFEQLGQVEKLLETGIDKKYPWSMFRFFDRAIYEKMVGNEFFGYYHDEGVVYDDPANRVAVDTIDVIKGRGYEKYREMFGRVFLETLNLHKDHTYKVDPKARFCLGICIVSVNEKGKGGEVPGVVLESYIEDRSTGRYFYHRCGTGSRHGLKQAMGMACARILCNLQYLKKKREATDPNRGGMANLYLLASPEHFVRIIQVLADRTRFSLKMSNSLTLRQRHFPMTSSWTGKPRLKVSRLRSVKRFASRYNNDPGYKTAQQFLSERASGREPFSCTASRTTPFLWGKISLFEHSEFEILSEASRLQAGSRTGEGAKTAAQPIQMKD